MFHYSSFHLRYHEVFLECQAATHTTPDRVQARQQRPLRWHFLQHLPLPPLSRYHHQVIPRVNQWHSQEHLYQIPQYPSRPVHTTYYHSLLYIHISNILHIERYRIYRLYLPCFNLPKLKLLRIDWVWPV